MLVKHRMTTDPKAVQPGDSLAHALRLTREHRIRHLPVVLNGELAGIVSDRDIRTAMPSPLTVADADRASFLERTPVESVMTREVITAGPLDTVEDAAKMLCRHRIGALPVVDAHGRLLGMISETDVLTAFAEVLSAAGYATAHFGKWHLGSAQGRLPSDQGFDEWYGIPRTTDEAMYPSQHGAHAAHVPFMHVMEGRKGEKSRDLVLYDLQQRRLIDAELTRRAIDFREGADIDEKAFKALIRAAVAVNQAKD
jgi:CBS domain-containing protein